MSELKRTCVDCGKEFTLSSGEISFYKSKGYALPKRCEDCRKARKNAAKEDKDEKTPVSPINENKKPKKKKKNKGGLKKKIAAAAAAVIAIAGAATGISLSGNDLPAPDETSLQTTLVTEATENDAAQQQEDIFNDENYTSGGTYSETQSETDYYFRSDYYLDQHYEKHGKEMGFASPEEYEAAASAVINNPDALTKTEKEDGDYVYYVEATNEFVILSTDGYIRTYFEPNDGLDYFNRQ